MDKPDEPDEPVAASAPRHRPTVYQVAQKAGVSIATVSRALRDEPSVAPATKQRVLDAARELARELDEYGPGRRRPTVYQVADLAGVSIATVSRTLKNDGTVSAPTRRRVLDAMAELNWSPSRAAKALAGAVTHDMVAIVFPDLSGPYYANVIAGFETEVAGRGSAVLVLATHGREASEQMVRDFGSRTDGLVIMDQTIPDAAVADLAAEVPVVLLARPGVSTVASVRTENTESARALTAHVLGHGRRALRFVGDPDLTPDVYERWTGFVLAHEDAGLAAAEPVRANGLAPMHGHEIGLDLLRERDAVGGGDFDALVCANDELASGVYRAAADLGVAIPEDIVVTGWDDVNIAQLLVPGLTTVRQPLRELGAAAGHCLFEQIETGAAHSTVLPTALVIRESCGC